MYKNRILVLIVFFSVLTALLAVDRYFSPLEIVQENNDEVSMADIEEAILALEYHVVADETAVYQAPNRVNGIRTLFHDDTVELVPRDAEADVWAVGFRLTQIGDDTDMTAVGNANISVDGNKIFYNRGNITEWYVNNDRGLEQGFTVEAHPSGSAADKLYVDMAIEGSLTGVANDGTAVEFVSQNGDVVLNYDKLFAFDANSKPLASEMSLLNQTDGSQTLRLTVDTVGAAFPIVIDPVASSADWIIGSAQNDQLGFSVATAGDVNDDGYDDVVVGANWYDAGAQNVGAAFLYFGGPKGLGTAVKWQGMGNKANAEYGFSVSSAGDVNNDGYGDVIVGAPGADSAYLYFGSATGLVNSTAQAISQKANSEFGFSVSAAGDVNDDGNDDVIVGAPSYTNAQGVVHGRAFVYYGNNTGIKSTFDWAVEREEDGGYFGISVSDAGDVNGDGIDDIVVGDSFGNNNLEDVGTIYVYLGGRSGLANGPVAQDFDADWYADDPYFDELSEFGFSVSSAGNLNGDQWDDIIVGAPFALLPESSAETGAAYIYFGPLDGQHFSVFPFETYGFQDGEMYGYSVAGAGDVDGDKMDDVIIGAPGYMIPQTARLEESASGVPVIGRAELFAGNFDAGPSFVPFLGSIEGDASDTAFGSSVDMAGDVNADGYSDVIIGAPTYPSSGQYGSGRAFTFHGTSEVSGLTAVNDGPTHLGEPTKFVAETDNPVSGFNTYTWDFGDGNVGSGQKVNHIYGATGFYTATVSVSNDWTDGVVTAVTLVNVVNTVLINPSSGGMANWQDNNGNSTNMNVPPGAVNEPIIVEFTPLDVGGAGRGISPAGIEQPLPANNTTIFFDLEASDSEKLYLPILGHQYNGSAPSVLSSSQGDPFVSAPAGTCDPDHYCFDEPVVLVIGYNPANLNGQNENELILVVWDENTNQWVDATSTCEVPSGYTYDPANNTFSLEICHISRFGVVGFN